jgi:hypothetical protein
MFSLITQNWGGKLLVSTVAIVELIAVTTTKTGLTVQCELDESSYANRRLRCFRNQPPRQLAFSATADFI